MTHLPDAALHQNIAILGKNGSGKTTAAKAMIAEPLLERGERVMVVDPTGAWWGLRSSRDGKDAGFQILVLGGDHGDLPLPATGGAAVARLVVEQGVCVVADTSQMTVGERTRWFTDFAGALYRANRAPLHLILDEAHNFAPQGKVPDPEAGKMLHAASTLASQGRSRGIRLTMITQRPQKLHKDSLTSAETLIALRVIAPQDRRAVQDWVDGCAGDGGANVIDTLAELARGEGWLWYPEGRLLKRMKFPPTKTFDSSATPMGGAIEAPKGAAAINLDEIREAMADAIREAEENDPKRLRSELARAQAELAKMRRSADSARAVSDSDRVAVDVEAVRKNGYALALRSFAPTLERLKNLGEALVETVTGAQADIQRMEASPAARQDAPYPVRQEQRAQPSATVHAKGGTLVKAERLILTALAQYPQGRSHIQVALLTQYTHSGGGFRNAIGALRSRGLVVGENECLRITQQGLAALGPFDPLPTGKALLQFWMGELGKAERMILEALASQHPGGLSPEQIASRAGYEATGGGFRNALGRLRTLELVKGRDPVHLSQDLFQ